MESVTRYMGFFLEGPIQIQSFVAVLVLWIGFSALGGLIGGLIGGRDRPIEVDPIIGWAFASLVMTIGGVFLAVPFTHSAVACAVLAVFGARFAWRREGRFVPIAFFKLLALFGPLLVLVSAMRGSQWDEFSTWLIVPQYLIETDAFPGRDNTIPAQALIAYPYSWHFISYLASRLAGVFLENAGALFNVFLLAAFALMVIRLIGRGLERDDLVERPPWPLIALAGLLVSLANPTFAQKVVLTAYADAASAMTTAVAAVLGWYLLEALIAGDTAGARRFALLMGGVFLVLINLKQATLVLLLLVLGAVVLVGLRDPRVRILGLAKLMPMILLPPLIIYAAWRYHVNLELPSREMSIAPFDAWVVHLIPKILWTMLTVLAKKGFYLFMVVVAAIVGIRGLIRSRTPFDRFAALTAAIVLGYNAFLLFVYVAVFGESDPPRVYSYWRYNMHLGLLVVGFIAYAAATLWRTRLAGRVSGHRLAGKPIVSVMITALPIALILAAPVVFAQKIRFDKSSMIRHYRAVGAAVAEQVRTTDGVYVFDPSGTGESAIITGYELAGRAALVAYLNAGQKDKRTNVHRARSNPKVTLVIVHSMLPELAGEFDAVLEAQASYLLRREPAGGWSVAASWPHPRP